MDSSLGIIFMRLGIAKIDQETIAKKLGDVPIIALNDFRADALVGSDNIPKVFRVELSRELGGVHEVAEHHSQLPSFCVGRRRCSNARCDLWGRLLLGSRRLCWLSRGSGDFLCIADPDQNSVILI